MGETSDMLGALCLTIVLIVIIIIAYDKYMKSGMRNHFNQGFSTTSQQLDSGPQGYPYYDLTGYTIDMYKKAGGINPYTFAPYSNA